MSHDVRDYDRFLQGLRQRQFDGLKDWNAAQKADVDPRIGLIANGLRTACEADPDALGGLDCWAAAQLIVARFF